MKVIKYKLLREVNTGTDEHPNIVQSFYDVITPWSQEQETVAKKEAHNGEITVEDDGQPDPEPSREEQLEKEVAELKAALNLLLTGVTE